MTVPPALDRDATTTRRKPLAALVALALLAALLAATAPSATARPTQRTAAVAMGDSFISGEGAGDYAAVADYGGTTGGEFPGWTAPNDAAYFCHRSANASIEVANLPGIDDRFNIACSGGVTFDIENPSHERDRGRRVQAQLDQLRSIATTHDIDLVLYGMGANDIGFSASALACINNFITDGFTGWWEVWVELFSPGATSQGACNQNDFPTSAEVAAATDSLEASLLAILDTLADVDPDGEHRIVLQNYVNPLPERFDRSYHSEAGRTDGRDKFRDLVRERYAAGCPVHMSSLGLADDMTDALAGMVDEVQHRVMLAHPNADVISLDVRDAFNGKRLCENAGSPDDALHYPVQARNDQGTPITSLGNRGKNKVKAMFDECADHFQLCQESLHPNAAGHELLGQCLAGAADSNRPVVWCNGSGGQVSPHERMPEVDGNIDMRFSEGLNRRGDPTLVLEASWFNELLYGPGRTVTSTSVRFNTSTATIATRTSSHGAVTATVPCSTRSVTVYASISVTLDDGQRINESASRVASCPTADGSGGGDQPIR